MFHRIYRILIWPTETLNAWVHQFAWAQQFNHWANEKEREYRRRRHGDQYAALAFSLRESGLVESAEKLERLA